MNTIGVLLLAAATATDGFGKPFAKKHWLRPHVVADGPAPPGGPMGGAAGCAFGHPGCQGGPSCPGGGRGRQPGSRPPVSQRTQPDLLPRPRGMKIGWQTAAGNGERVYLPAQLVVPARYNFMQGYIYRLKLTDIPGRPNLALYPTIEVAPSTPATDAYLTHNPIPVQFTAEDFDQVTAATSSPRSSTCPIRSTRSWRSRASRRWSRPGSSRASTRSSRPTGGARSC